MGDFSIDNSRGLQRCGYLFGLALAIQSVARLIMLKPIFNLGYSSIIFHSITLVFLFLTMAITASICNKFIFRLAISCIFAFVEVFFIIFDAISISTGRLMNFALPLKSFLSLYCANFSTFYCIAQYKTVMIFTIILFFVLMILFFALFTIIYGKRLKVIGALKRQSTRTRWLLATLLAGLPVSSLAIGLSYPDYFMRREPLAAFLFRDDVLAGPAGLLTGIRRDHTVAKSPDAHPRPIILITVDALRYDAADVRDPNSTLTPFLRSLAAAGHLHDLGPATPVCPASYCGIMGIQGSSYWSALQEGPPITLPDVLVANGYRTNYLLSGPHRYAYNMRDLYGPNINVFLDDSSPDSSGMADDREDLARFKSLSFEDPDRLFVNFHLMSAHPAGLRIGESTQLVRKWLDILISGTGSKAGYHAYYNKGVRQADTIISQIFDQLKRKKILSRALVIITADHGERVGNGESLGHGGSLDMSLGSIPLLVYDESPQVWPSQPLPSQMDIAPTILRAINADIPATWLGQPLQTPINRPAAPFDWFRESALVIQLDGKRSLLSCNLENGQIKLSGMTGPAKVLTTQQGHDLFAQRSTNLKRRQDAQKCYPGSSD